MANYWQARRSGATRKQAFKADIKQTLNETPFFGAGLSVLAVGYLATQPKITMAEPPSFNSAAVKMNVHSLGVKPEGATIGFGVSDGATTGKIFFNKKMEIGSATAGICPFGLAKNGPIDLRIGMVQFNVQYPFAGNVGLGYAPKYTSVNDNGSWSHDASMWWNSKWGINAGVQITGLNNDEHNVIVSAETVVAKEIVVSSAYQTKDAVFAMGADGQVWIFPLRASVTMQEGTKGKISVGATAPIADGVRVKVNGKDVTGDNPEISVTVETPLPF